MDAKIRIPCVVAQSSYAGASASIPGQPIMEFKELEPDLIRYDTWKAWLAREQEKERRKKKRA